MGTRRRTLTSLVTAALCALALVGCSSGGGSGSGGGNDVAATSGAGGGAEVDREPAADPADLDGRQVIVTASAEVVVDDPAAASDAIAALAAAAGGRVEAREEYAGDEHGSATLTLRVPSGELNGLLEDLDDLGEVQWINQSEEDVTGTVVDLDARIAALETSTQRLSEIMAGAETTEDLLDVETQLSERQAELEALQSQRDALADQVALSTLTVSLNPVAAAPAQARGGFLGGLESGWNALSAFFGMVLVVLGALLPWVVALGVPTVAALWLWRRYRRTHPARARGDVGPRPPGPAAAPAGAYENAAASAAGDGEDPPRPR